MIWYYQIYLNYSGFSGLSDVSEIMAIYTKTGDKGKTSTFGGKRVSKSSKPINAIGAVDELNSFLGIVLAGARQDIKILRYKDIEKKILEIQKNLFTINAILAGAKLVFPKDAVKGLEKQIDEWEGDLPVQKNFLIYGGTKTAAQIYFARALARRAERSLVSFKIPDSRFQILVYMNRLSDYLFMLARIINFRKKIKETIWKK